MRGSKARSLGPRGCRAASAFALLLAAIGPSIAGAQPGPAAQVAAAPFPGAGGAGGVTTRSLKAHVGLEAARSLLTADDPKARVRGVLRLGTLTDPQAIDTLVLALDPGTVLSRDLDARLAAVGVLAGYVYRADVRAYLGREVTAPASLSRTTSSVGGRIRGMAALALARAGDEKSLGVLLVALEQHGAPSDAARAALLAYPPASLDPFLLMPKDDANRGRDGSSTDEDALGVAMLDDRTERGARDHGITGDAGKEAPDPETKSERKARVLSPALLDFLGELGDVRAVPALRAALTATQASTRAHAALALARFGDPAGLAEARKDARSGDDKIVELAARTLVLLDDGSDDGDADDKSRDAKPPVAADKGASKDEVVVDPKALRIPVVRAVWRLLRASGAHRTAFDLIADSASPKRFLPLVPLIESLARSPAEVDRANAVLVLARLGGPSAMNPFLDDEEMSHVAAYALATSLGDAATNALAAGLTTSKPGSPKHRLMVRALVVRSLALGVSVSGLREALEALSRSKDDADLETAAFGRIALGGSVSDVVGKPSAAKPAVVAGAARGALFGGREALVDLAPLMAGADDGEDPSLTHVSAGVALVTSEGRRDVPQKTLLAWVEGGGPLAPVAALALPSRDDDAIHPRIKELLLEGTDPLIRSHIALGLADDPDPSSVSLLVEAYAADASREVRRNVIRALSRRTEPQRDATLRLARDLDPDDGVRALARRSLVGPIPADLPRAGLEVSWTKVERTDGTRGPMAGRFLRADGLALPLVSAADGDVLEPTPPGLASLHMVESEAR